MSASETGTQNYGDWQYELYLRGLAGERPRLPTAWAEVERAAGEALAPEPRGYVWGGAGTGDTMRANLEAFRRWRIVPRMLRDVGVRDLRTTILGTEMPAPVLLAPVGVQTIVHDEGELASARGAAALGVPVVASTAAAHSLEEIADAAGDAPRWYQLYWPKDDEITKSIVQRAERAGYQAIVVTLDTMELAWRPADLGHGYLPFLEGTGIAQFLSDPVFRATLARPPEEDMQAAVGQWVAVINKFVTWQDLAFLRSLTSLPILLKGILHPDDARAALAHGVDGVIVSNHGGRQVDGAIAALDALAAIADAVGSEITVLFDSGIRCGADVVKALALGAEAVLVGRPYLWGLALDGQAGVETVLRMLLAELDLTLALSGYRSPSEVGRGAIAPLS
jgi:isopentenyl diphosphate isomerase/L-lactate dehydrogenase-like FMN-dependent dehydrogenase